jgi:hypothetical protein
MKRVILIALALLGLAAGTVGCGREPVTSERAEGGTTGATTSEAAPSESLQGVMDSYLLAKEEIEEEGGEQEVGEYTVGYIVEPAEGWWEGDSGDLDWREPAPKETNHLEVLPFDSDTGLLIPYMDITLTVLDESGEEVESKPLAFYYAEFYHYANNFQIPKNGTYTLRATLNPPTFHRHGDEDGEGKVFTSRAVVEFDDVQIDTGKEE